MKKKEPKPPGKEGSLTDPFTHFARHTSKAVGSPWAFAVAALVILVWAATGPIFGYSDTWQLVINTGTTVVTFLMVFLIQNTQNRDSRAVHLKLDEVIRAVRGARNDLIALEDMTDSELKTLADDFAAIHERERKIFEKHGHSLLPEECEKGEEGEPPKARKAGHRAR